MSGKFKRILYGGDYNPNQWPKEIWKEDMAYFKDARINSATINVFSWARLQPSEEVYDFSQLDEIVDMLSREGYDIIMATSTGAMPAWMVTRYPETARTDYYGRHHKFGQRHNACPNSLVYQKYAGALAGKLARRYGNNPHIVCWHVNNEYGGECYCENCEKAFRIWLRKKYKTLDALNEAREKTGFNRQRFVPYFQPKVDMRDGSLAGAEALARGIDSKGNIITPAQFIESLENDGSIRDLDLFMLDSVLRQLSEWQMKGLPLIKVSINISRVTLFNPTILASVLAIQSRYPNIPPDQIELEITETGGDMEKATLACIVDNFRECGLKFELDDFGTGYANMTVFSNIKFETIKLDRTLVGDLPGNEISSVLVENITKICENFGMQCIAEGVETRQQEAALLDAGCIYGQGFYYAKPLPSDEFEQRYLSGAYAAGQAK